MFASNQVLEISGSFNQLEAALRFALDYSGESKNMREEEYQRGCRLTFQVTEDGRYCIGWFYKEKPGEKLPDGWQEYPFRFSVLIVAKIIEQHLNQFDAERDIWDGGYEKGFLMKAIPESMSEETAGIKEPFYGIVSFAPYTCFYSK